MPVVVVPLWLDDRLNGVFCQRCLLDVEQVSLLLQGCPCFSLRVEERFLLVLSGDRCGWLWFEHLAAEEDGSLLLLSLRTRTALLSSGWKLTGASCLWVVLLCCDHHALMLDPLGLGWHWRAAFVDWRPADIAFGSLLCQVHHYFLGSALLGRIELLNRGSHVGDCGVEDKLLSLTALTLETHCQGLCRVYWLLLLRWIW